MQDNCYDKIFKWSQSYKVFIFCLSFSEIRTQGNTQVQAQKVCQRKSTIKFRLQIFVLFIFNYKKSLIIKSRILLYERSKTGLYYFPSNPIIFEFSVLMTIFIFFSNKVNFFQVSCTVKKNL